MSSPLRIAIVTPSVSRRGGTEKCLSWLVEDLSRSCLVTVFTAEFTDTDGSRLRPKLLPVIPRPRLLRYLTFLAANTLALRLAWLRRGNEFDVVLSTAGDCLFSDVVYSHFCCRAWRDLIESGKVSLPVTNPRQWLRNLHYRAFLNVASVIERAIYNRRSMRAVVAVSDGTAREISDYYGVEPKRISVVANAVDERVYLTPAQRLDHRQQLRAGFGISEATLTALFVAAGDWKRKGLLAVLEALRFLSDKPVHLLVVGDEDIPFYKGVATDLGVPDKVSFCGFTSEVERYYAAADVFVYPSAYEAFPLVSLEAAAAGLPLIVTRINGTEELVQDGENGFFVAPDAADIAEKLCLLLDNPSLRARMSAAAALSSRRYSRAAVVEHILAVCRSAAAAPKGVREAGTPP